MEYSDLEDNATSELFAAVKAADFELVGRQLIRGAKPNAVDGEGHTPLYYATEKNAVTVIHILVQGGAKADAPATSACRSTPLHIAAMRGQCDAMSELIKARPDVNVRNDDGTTPLMMAAKLGGRRVAKILLDAGADPSAEDARGRTAMFYAITLHEPLSTIGALLDGGADESALVDGEHTPLELAVKCNRMSVADFLIARDAHLSASRPDGDAAADPEQTREPSKFAQ